MPCTHRPSTHAIPFTALLVILAVAILPGTTRAATFGYGNVVDVARALAAKPFAAPAQVPAFLQDLTYDEYRDIRFRPDRALWRKENLPFQIQFFHPGFYFKHAVTINVVDTAGVHPVPFDTDMFDYGKNHLSQKIPADLGFAGFRIHYPLNRPDYHDELAVFLGASYFRALARHTVYGLSARGLAVDTAEPSGEEFPFFKEFWLVKPAKDARELTVYALMDSQSLAGAYRFVIRPGAVTVTTFPATTFERKKVAKFGIAPLTSMFFYGENSYGKDAARATGDFRPEVHDSDGLLLADGTGEWIWRPLVNPQHLEINDFQADGLRGFGLMQRDRNFDHYQDLEARYDLRPSAWVTPQGNWGKGHVELVQIPSDTEKNDNIVAFWVPDHLPAPGQPITFAYDLHWLMSETGLPPAGRVVATRVANGEIPDTRMYVLDFEGGRLGTLRAGAPVEGIVSAGPHAKVVEQHVEKNPVTGGWRLVFQLTRDDARPVELRAFLKDGQDILTETWSYMVQP